MMRLAAILLAVSPLLVLELALRWVSPVPAFAVDFDPWVDLHQLRPLFVLDESQHRWRIGAERMNFFQPASFAAEKPPGALRLFVLGGSTVQGRPYAPPTAFSKWLQLRLQAADADREIEVVNCGGVSYASYRVAKILDEVLQHQPDAIVLYTGHNEFLEDREYAEVRQFGATDRWISQLAAKFHTVRWIQSRWLVDNEASEGLASVMPGEVDTRLDHAGGLDKYQRDDVWRSGVEAHFAETLKRMVQRCRQAEVPLVLCLPACDLVQTPPFKTTMKAGLSGEQQQRFQSAWSIADHADQSIAERLQACREALDIDPEHAGANYLAGKILFSRGETESAARLLTAARDFDVCPLRATTPIVEAVTGEAHSAEILFVDTVALLDRRDHESRRIPDGIADPSLFVDHVHPSIPGHQAIAGEIAIALSRYGWFPSQTNPRVEARYQELASKHLESLGEDYFARGQQRLEGLKKWASGRVRD